MKKAMLAASIGRGAVSRPMMQAVAGGQPLRFVSYGHPSAGPCMGSAPAPAVTFDWLQPRHATFGENHLVPDGTGAVGAGRHAVGSFRGCPARPAAVMICPPCSAEAAGGLNHVTAASAHRWLAGLLRSGESQ